ncbi:MAG: cytochrome C [Planctomycetes bacterium]|nr:cytochrome C [Planctomycetota bacterium]
MTDAQFRVIIEKPDNIPIVIMLCSIGFLLWLAFRKMAINDGLIEQGLPTIEARESKKRVMCWPDLIYSEFLIAILVTIALLWWAIEIKAPLEEPANPAVTPNPSKAPWYFLGLQEMLVYYDPWLAGVVFPTLIIGGLQAIPYIDMNTKGNGYFTFKERPFAITVYLFGFIVLWVLLIMLGTFLRGPNWSFFGFFEYWDIHKLTSLNNVNLSEYFWNTWLGMPLPENIFLRELPGFAVVIFYFAALPPILANTVFKRFFIECGFIRYNVMANLFLFMAALPIKMALRWLFNLKYIVGIPEWFFNI